MTESDNKKTHFPRRYYSIQIQVDADKNISMWDAAHELDEILSKVDKTKFPYMEIIAIRERGAESYL